MAAAEITDSLEADAFKKLYPDQFYARFIADGIRPDGRPLGRARTASIGLGAVSTADSSALVKFGNSTALAGIKLEIMVPKDDTPNQGQLSIAVEMAPMCSPDMRPGRPSDAAQVLVEQLNNALLASAKAVNLDDLCIDPGKAAWVAYLDIYVLDSDGSLADVTLLAAVAALATLRLPHVAVTDGGNVVPSSEAAEAAAPDEMAVEPTKLQLRSVPLALTCGLYKDQLIVGLTAEEEALVATSVTTIVDDQGRLIGQLKAGGRAEMDIARLQDCIEAAKLRYAELAGILQQAITQYDGSG
ncbi:hypothetical protein WJX72_005082 [[Myrmecia] bisecta]|uniref:Ribosomal RNA-processing protein 43 n=1 Tax=[Myrmecia] bisecta TaxID=41462 RepID=A0AAW1PP33_9CHLO